MPSTYKKDKPWDTDDIDKWKVSQLCATAFWAVLNLDETSTNMTINRSKNSSLRIIPVAHSPRSHRLWLFSPNTAKSTWRKHGRWLRGPWRSRVSLAPWIWLRVAWRWKLQERHSTLQRFSMLVTWLSCLRGVYQYNRLVSACLYDLL